MNPYAGERATLLERLARAGAEAPRETPSPAGSRKELRYLAFYLPQFHPIPENNAWWGDGFTEWTNATAGKPSFPGHHQPHLPSPELGLYDLRDPGVRELQVQLARSHGIDGFVYYHYWFGGRRLLERPFDEVLASGSPDFPFCLCWANENWTRRWDGGDESTLMEQRYSDEDDLEHIRWLVTAFEDPRYVRVDGKPVLLVYRASQLPDARLTTDTWRAEAARLGVGELYLCRVEAFGQDRGDPTALGFDAGVEFQPDWWRRGRQLPYPAELQDSTDRDPSISGIFSYPVVAELALMHAAVPYKRYRCVMPGWDNSARRRGGATIYLGSTPARYEQWLAGVIDQFQPYCAEENLLFINAWNEWGEGNHLEPDTRWGGAYLEAHRRATRRAVPEQSKAG